MEQNTSSETQPKLKALLEALLFAAPGPVTPGQLASALDQSEADVNAALEQLERSYLLHANEHGIRLQRYRGRI